MKKIIKFFIIVACLLYIGLTNGSNIYASPTNPNIILNKTATKTDITYDRKVNVELEIDGKNLEKTISKDIVIVIDESDSMNELIDNEKKIDLIKTETIKLITSLLNQNDKTKIGIVVFGSDLLNNYTTNSLTNNLSDLTTLITSIPKIENEATNIQIGLNKAYKLLEKSNAKQKHIILLTDGNPTVFTYKDDIYGTGYDDSSVCYSGFIHCKKAKPSERAKLEVDKIKEKDIKLWTVGVTVDDTAKNFLKDIGDNYYDIKNSDDLTKTIKTIDQKIETIMINSIVEDKISPHFILDETSLTTNYGKVQIENDIIQWDIGDLLGPKKIKLNYTLTAKEPYYGNIWTNDYASLTGNLINDGSYNTWTSEYFFQKPIAPIPAIALNDNFEIRETETLTNNILTNDKLEIINNDNATINNKIIITKNVSCGSLDVKDNGNITYNSMECIDNVDFSYYILSKINNTEVKSSTATVNINIKKYPTTYTIKYTDELKNDLINSVNKNGNLNDLVQENYIEIEGYELISSKKKELKLQKENNIIEFTYKKIDYSIDKNNITKNGTIIINNKNEQVDYALSLEKEIDNYKGPITLKVIDYLPYEINIEDSTIDDGIYNEENKTITWILEDNVNTYKNGKYNIDFNRTLSIKYKDISDKTFKNKIESTISLLDYDNIINNDEWETTLKENGIVITKYIDKAGNNLIDSIIIDGLIGSKYETKRKNFDNYELIDIWNSENGYITNEDIEVTYIYDKVLTPPKTGSFENNNYLYLIISIICTITIIIKKSIEKRISN